MSRWRSQSCQNTRSAGGAVTHARTQCVEGATSAWYEVSGKVKHVVQSSSWKQVGGVAGLQRAQRTANPGPPPKWELMASQLICYSKTADD